MQPASSLAARAALAVALMFGFYLMALAIAGFLLGFVYVNVVYAERIYVRLVIFCIVGAGLILWSIIPRPDRFIAPGPSLSSEEQPRLLKTLAGVASATEQEMPSEVYLVPDVNAWVANRGGVMGFGSRRVMGLGLPLLQVLSVSELRAVLAHEFGHFYGGDTKLGPWVYKTRAAIGRTLQGLAQHSSVLQAPFLWYGKMFLRITHAVSRQQELSADRLAARVAGARPLIEGLKRVHGAGPAFNAYWSNEAMPVLSHGFRPPLAAGFGRYLASSEVAETLSTYVSRELKEGAADPYDTHPSLRERIAALQGEQERGEPTGEPPAISLLEDVEGLEGRLLKFLSDEKTVGALKAVTWEDVGERVWIPAWEAHVKANANALKDVTVAALPGIAADLEGWARERSLGEDSASPEERRGQTSATVGAALAVALKRRGWTFECAPGDEVVLISGGTRIAPFGVLSRLGSGELSPQDWERTCREAGIADLRLLEEPAA